MHSFLLFIKCRKANPSLPLLPLKKKEREDLEENGFLLFACVDQMVPDSQHGDDKKERNEKKMLTLRTITHTNKQKMCINKSVKWEKLVKNAPVLIIKVSPMNNMKLTSLYKVSGAATKCCT